MICIDEFRELTAELEAMLHTRRAKHYPSTLSPPPASDGLNSPCGFSGVGGDSFNVRN